MAAPTMPPPITAISNAIACILRSKFKDYQAALSIENKKGYISAASFSFH